MPSIKDYLSDSLPQIYKKFSYLVFFVLEEVGKGTQVDIQKPPPQSLRRGFLYLLSTRGSTSESGGWSIVRVV